MIITLLLLFYYYFLIYNIFFYIHYNIFYQIIGINVLIDENFNYFQNNKVGATKSLSLVFVLWGEITINNHFLGFAGI